MKAGLYIHVPFCHKICHYCDFAKTAGASHEMVTKYWQWLYFFLDRLCIQLADQQFKFSSVFLGGGTPSMFTDQWQPVFEKLQAFVDPTCEITLEANPEDISISRLEYWSKLGINRLSLGIQSFDSLGLAFLTRTHTPDQAKEAVKLAQFYMESVSLDLIYAWPKQTQESLVRDLETAASLDVSHLSFYNLSYEPRTTIGRRLSRGLIQAKDESVQASMYQEISSFLASNGYTHEELANWSKPGFACKHNWLYWSDQAYLAAGAGAHGYLPRDYESSDSWGMRYAFTSNLLKSLELPRGSASNLKEFVSSWNVTTEQLSRQDWLIDVIATSFRTKKGVDIDYLSSVTNMEFRPNQTLERAMGEGLVQIDKNQRLILKESEWIREHAWSLELLLSFKG